MSSMNHREDHIWFRKTLAELGVEATLDEAADNYAGLMVAAYAVTDQGRSVDEAIDAVQQFAGEGFHPAVCKQLLEQMVVQNTVPQILIRWPVTAYVLQIVIPNPFVLRRGFKL